MSERSMLYRRIPSLEDMFPGQKGEEVEEKILFLKKKELCFAFVQWNKEAKRIYVDWDPNHRCLESLKHSGNDPVNDEADEESIAVHDENCTEYFNEQEFRDEMKGDRLAFYQKVGK